MRQNNINRIFFNKNLISNFFYSEPQLSLVEAPVLAPGEVTIDQAQINEMQNEIEQAAQMELPDDDDGFWGSSSPIWYGQATCTLIFSESFKVGLKFSIIFWISENCIKNLIHDQ